MSGTNMKTSLVRGLYVNYLALKIKIFLHKTSLELNNFFSAEPFILIHIFFAKEDTCTF